MVREKEKKTHTLSSAKSQGKLPTLTNLGYEWMRNSMVSVCWKEKRLLSGGDIIRDTV